MLSLINLNQCCKQFKKSKVVIEPKVLSKSNIGLEIRVISEVRSKLSEVSRPSLSFPQPLTVILTHPDHRKSSLFLLFWEMMGAVKLEHFLEPLDVIVVIVFFLSLAHLIAIRVDIKLRDVVNNRQWCVIVKNRFTFSHFWNLLSKLKEIFFLPRTPA